MFKHVSFKQSCLATRLILLAFGLGISSWAPMVPYVKTRLNVDDAELGLILFVFGIGALIAMPVAGYILHQFGSRLITFISAMFVILVLPFLAITSTVPTVCLTLFLFGIGTGFWNVSINAQAVVVESKSDRPLMSGFHCLFSVGGLFGALIVTCLLELGFSLVFCALVISSMIGLIVALQWKKLLPDQEGTELEQAKYTFSFPNIQVIFLGLICFISFMTEGSMLDWSAEFLRSELDYQTSIAGIGFAIFSIAMASGRFLGDKIIQKLGAAFVFQVGCFLTAFGFIVVVYFGWGYTERLGFFLIGLGASNIVPILFSSTGRLSDGSAKYALTIVTTFGYLGMLIGPAFIGFIAQATTLSFAFLCLSLLLVTVGVKGRAVVMKNS